MATAIIPQTSPSSTTLLINKTRYVNCPDAVTVNNHEFTKSHTPTRLSSKSIMNELNNYNLPDDVKLEADNIYQSREAGIKRELNKQRIISSCVYQAFKNVGRPEDPKTVATLIGVQVSEMDHAISATSGKSIININSPLEYIPNFVNKINLNSSCIEDILKLAADILSKDTEMQEDKPPHAIAAAILLYYLKINGVVINRKLFSDNVFRISSLTKLVKKIEIIHNT